MQRVHTLMGARRRRQIALYAGAGGLLLLSLARAAVVGTGAERAARAFYDAYMQVRVVGVPSRTQQAKFAPVVSAALAALLRDASRTEEAHRRRTKNQEPPLVEGDLFTSLFEGAHASTIASCTQSGVTAQCLVTLTYVDPRDASQHTWTDQALLVRQKGRWVVDDIAFGGGWDFARKGRLTESLRAVATYRTP